MKVGDTMTVGDASIVVRDVRERQVKLAVKAPSTTKIKIKPLA